MMKKYSSILPLIFASIIFIFLQSLVFNKELYFRDEGFLMNNAVRILNGEIPYRDFFLTTTPGTYYLQSLIFKFLGVHIILGRLLYIFCVIALLIIMNFLLNNINVIYKTFILLLTACVFVEKGAFAFYNIEGLILLLLAISVYIYTWQNKNFSKKRIFLVGTIIGLLIIFKQSYGIYAVGAFTSLFFIYNHKNYKYAFKQLTFFLCGLLVILTPFVGYYIWNKAFSQFIYFTFVFAQEVKWHRSAFILTSLLFIPLFLIVLHIIKRMPIKKAFVVFGIFLLGFFLLYLAISPDRLGRILTYIKDPLIYYYGFLLTFPLLLIAYFANQNNKIVPYSVFLLSLFLASASSGRDYATVIMVFPLVILLCLELIRITGRKYLVLVIIVYSLIPYIFFGQLLKSLSSLMTYKQLQLLQFEGIYLPPKTADEILSIVKFVQKKTNQNDTILCFPYCPLFNVLTQRKSGSYFSFFYPETIRAKDQKRVIDDLKKNQTKIIILQKPGEIEKEALYENNRLSLLRNYFLSNYNPVFSSQNFVIYQINNSNKKLSP